MKILICEDSIDGIFTAIYDIWALKYNKEEVKVQLTGQHNIELFAEYIMVESNLEKSMKVTRTIYNRFGEDAYSSIYHAALSYSTEKADAIYHVIQIGLGLAKSSDIMNHLSNPYVYTTFMLSRQTFNEGHHFLGFIRFIELNNGILLSKICPKNNILTVISSHFSERLPLENWIIYDTTRNLALVHEAHMAPILVQDETLNLDATSRLSPNEQEFQTLWKTFFKSIAIKERINPKLQKQNFPKRFWSNIIEFQGEDTLT